MQAADNIQEAIAAFNDSDYLTFAQQLGFAGLNAAGAAAGLRLGFTSCFAAGTPLLTPDGFKPIEQFQVGDLVLSRSEDDPESEPVPKRVIDLLQSYSPLLHINVRGQVIRTTAEHAFWVIGRGWVEAQQLLPGDLLLGASGQQVLVDSVEGPIAAAPVYNVAVQDYHTYLVGEPLWGYSIWVHNACVKRPGTRGYSDHQIDVQGAGREAARKQLRKGETLLTERPVQGFPGVNRRPDNQIVGKNGKTRLVVESERRPNGPYNQKRLKLYKRLGIKVITRPPKSW